MLHKELSDHDTSYCMYVNSSHLNIPGLLLQKHIEVMFISISVVDNHSKSLPETQFRMSKTSWMQHKDILYDVILVVCFVEMVVLDPESRRKNSDMKLQAVIGHDEGSIEVNLAFHPYNFMLAAILVIPPLFSWNPQWKLNWNRMVVGFILQYSLALFYSHQQPCGKGYNPSVWDQATRKAIYQVASALLKH